MEIHTKQVAVEVWYREKFGFQVEVWTSLVVQVVKVMRGSY